MSAVIAPATAYSATMHCEAEESKEGMTLIWQGEEEGRGLPSPAEECGGKAQ